MSEADVLQIRLVALPGLEHVLAGEARAAGFKVTSIDVGGVNLSGDWQVVWRANLTLRGASRVLVRLGSFRAMHLAQLDKRARKFPWGEIFRADVPLKVDVTCRKSKIYHAGAAKQRVERAIAEELGARITEDALLRVMVRIEDDLCTVSVDSSGAPLHQRGHKQAVGKAPLRETMAALFLRQAGYTGAEPVVDPMCGSGTIPIEAAEIACGLLPGRTRAFAFERFANFDADAWEALREAPKRTTDQRIVGSDRDAGAIRMAGENAERAGVSDLLSLSSHAISDAEPPEGPPGLVLTNPPYGRRIGNKKLLFGLYGALGEVLRSRFEGWRVGIVTSEPGLAKATGLKLKQAGAPVLHGGLKIGLWLGGPIG
ncbi:MAG: class I SAM-dependent RNA methyltransferase [Pseudomonadota bacterium]